jgi:hypothetical protein
MGPLQLSQCYGYRAYTQTTRKAQICTCMHVRCRPPHAPEDMLNPARHAPRGAAKSGLHAPCVRHTQRPQCLPARPLAPRGKSSSSRPSKRCWSHRITQLHNTHTQTFGATHPCDNTGTGSTYKSSPHPHPTHPQHVLHRKRGRLSLCFICYTQC